MVTKWISKIKNGEAAGQATIGVRSVKAGGEVEIDWITGLTSQIITGPSENISEIMEKLIGEQVDANEILLYFCLRVRDGMTDAILILKHVRKKKDLYFDFVHLRVFYDRDPKHVGE